MKDQSVLEKVQKQICEMTTQRAQQMEVIYSELSKARAQKAAADDAAKAATEKMDLAAWNRAAEEKKAAEMAEEMYSSRLSQINGKEMISEEESDRVIDSLTDYIRNAENEFDTKLGKILRDLRALYRAHIADIQTAENVIQTWTNDIHKNYRSSISLFLDPKTGERTNRAPHPVPVHHTNGQGGRNAQLVYRFLNDFPSLLADPEKETGE